MLEAITQGTDLKKLAQKYVLYLDIAGEFWAADDMTELTAALCGKTYVDAEWEETKWHMRRDTAMNVGLYLITSMEADMGFPDDDDFEPIIIYDERIGKIPYNYTDPIVDYDIHGEPQLMRVESEETFIYTMIKLGVAKVYEFRENKEKMVSIDSLYDIDKLLEEEIETFRHIDERVPLHKKLGE